MAFLQSNQIFVVSLRDGNLSSEAAWHASGPKFNPSFGTFFHGDFVIHYVNISVLIKFSQKTSVFTLIIISSP